MIVRALITLVLAVPAFWLTLRYNMHMFQLNGYINKEQTAWLRKNRHLQWILWFAMILGLVRMILPAQLYGVVDIVLDVLIWLTLIVIILPLSSCCVTAKTENTCQSRFAQAPG